MLLKYRIVVIFERRREDLSLGRLYGVGFWVAESVLFFDLSGGYISIHYVLFH